MCVYIYIYTHMHTHVQGGIKNCKPHPAFDFLANTLTLYTVKATKNAWLARPSATVGARQSSTVLLAACSSTRSLPSGFQLPSLEVRLCLGGCCASQEIVGRWPWDAPLCGAVRTKATLEPWLLLGARLRGTARRCTALGRRAHQSLAKGFFKGFHKGPAQGVVGDGEEDAIEGALEVVELELTCKGLGDRFGRIPKGPAAPGAEDEAAVAEGHRRPKHTLHLGLRAEHKNFEYLGFSSLLFYVSACIYGSMTPFIMMEDSKTRRPDARRPFGSQPPGTWPPWQWGSRLPGTGAKPSRRRRSRPHPKGA